MSSSYFLPGKRDPMRQELSSCALPSSDISVTGRASLSEIFPSFSFSDSGNHREHEFRGEADAFCGFSSALFLLWERIAQYLRGQILVDLGCGNNLAGLHLAEACGARAYVGVDLHNTHPELQSNIPSVFVSKLDMKKFCRDLATSEPGSASFLFCGVGDEIRVQHPNAQDLLQSVHRDGAIIDYCSNIRLEGITGLTRVVAQPTIGLSIWKRTISE